MVTRAEAREWGTMAVDQDDEQAEGAKKTATAKKATKKTAKATAGSSTTANYPRHAVKRSLRVPEAIIDQNAGHDTSAADAARFLGVKASGNFNLEVSSAKKYGFLESKNQKLVVTDRAKRALRPQSEDDELSALREAVLAAPDVSDVYNHYRGENLPDEAFFANALTERFGIPADKTSEFKTIFLESLHDAELITQDGDRYHIANVGRDESHRDKPAGATPVSRSQSSDAVQCFVMQPFAEPYGGYYTALFKPAVEQAGLVAIRADADIFSTGKIMDQVWRGIHDADVLVAELTTRNPNVFYELGLAHALGKPVILVAAREEDVPFDLKHIRVIYYDTNDPFWGQKLIDKVADNIRSALDNPEEAIFRGESE